MEESHVTQSRPVLQGYFLSKRQSRHVPTSAAALLPRPLPMSLSKEPKHRLLDSFPGSRAGVDNVKVTRSGNLKQVCIFLLFA